MVIEPKFRILVDGFFRKGHKDAEFKAKKLDQLLQFSEEERLAIMVLAIEELREDIRKLQQHVPGAR